VEIARENGIKSFNARIRESNRAMLQLIHAVVGRVEMDVFEDVYRVRFELPALPKSGQAAPNRGAGPGHAA
jgi:hypothetical protein